MTKDIIGKSFKVAFKAPYVFKLDFHSQTSMSFTPIAADGTLVEKEKNIVETTRVEIRPNVYMVYWSEPLNKNTTVTHVQDFENEKVWTNITTLGIPFINMQGTLTAY